MYEVNDPKWKDKTVDLVTYRPALWDGLTKATHKKEKHKKIEGDTTTWSWLPAWVSEVARVTKEDAHLYIWCSWHKVDVFKTELRKTFQN